MAGRKRPHIRRVRYSAQAVIDIKTAIESGKSWRDIIIEALTEHERRVLNAMPKAAVTTQDVSVWLDCTVSYASGVLYQLYAYGLVTRQRITNENGKYYVYKAVKE